MRGGVLIAGAIVVVRIVLEQAGVSDAINNIFGVAWLYLILPVFFALAARAGSVHPYRNLLKNVFLFAVYTRAMVMATYMLAYIFKWSSPRFVNVRPGIDVWTGIASIPARLVLVWVVMASVTGMVIGCITLLVRRKAPASVPKPQVP
jgi:hypothetical protein